MSGDSRTRNRRILVADDLPTIHADFRKILSPPEHTSAAFAEAERALLGESASCRPEIVFEIDSAFQGEEVATLVKEAAAAGRPYALAFVDVRMPPGSDGIETVRKILEIDPEIQIVICTAYSDFSWKEIFAVLGARDGVVILKKPFEVVEVLQLAHSMTEKWSLHRQAEQRLGELERLLAERSGELRRTEALYRGAITGTGAIPYALDLASGTYIFMGEGIEELIGYAPHELSQPVWNEIVQESVMLGEAAGLSRDEARRRVRMGKIREWRCDMLIRTRAGASRWISDSSVVDFDEAEPVRAMGILQDMTERKTIERQFLRGQRMENIGTLAGGIAHDLNNVLAPITMAVGLLQTDEEDEARRHLLSTIEISARRGANMVNQVLAFTRGFEGERFPIQVKYLVGELEKMANDTFMKHIRVSATAAHDLWPVVGDSTQIHQVLLNLIVNARDAMPEGGDLHLLAENVRIETPREKASAPGPYICIRVKDTGSGISPDIMDKIFEPFFTTKESGKGTGLGLSTSLSIVKGHGGFLDVESEPGRGTIFRVYLPAQPDAAGDVVAEPESAIAHGGGECVLVVDDEEHVRQMVRCVLDSFGYRVVLASDGKEALDIYRERHGEIDVVLTDMMMPGMDGGRVIRAVREIDAEARILAVSGVPGSAGEFDGLDDGNFAFLSKPYTMKSLLNALRALTPTIGHKAATGRHGR